MSPEPRFTFFGGKGGVGKTTCAAAAAIRAAAEGARVLVVSTDPAHSLGDALGLGARASLTRDARRIRTVPGELYAAELDADHALGQWLREREDAIRAIADRGTYLDDEDIERFLSLSFPGVDELVGLVELMRLSRIRPYDVVIVDTAPTGHTLRLLETPNTLARLGQILDDMHAKHRFLASSIGGIWRPDFADEAIADIENEARALRELLCDRSRASFTWVTLPEELPVRESEDAVQSITELGPHVEVIVVNRVWPAPLAGARCALCQSRAAAERIWKGHIGETFTGRTLLEIPARTTEPRGAEELLAVAGSTRYLAIDSPAVREKQRSERQRRPRSTLQIDPTVRLAFFGGKGGVGKTSVAAASAIAQATARPRDRVLLLSTDPAHSLGDVLSAKVSDEPRSIPGAPKNLHVRELDAANAWAVEQEQYRDGIDELFASIFRGMEASFDQTVLEDLLDLAPPGIDELLALVALLDAVVDSDPLPALDGRRAQPSKKLSSSRYDLVVVDTAPTGHTLRLLSLPASALEWVHALMTVILKYRSVIGLNKLASDLTRFAKRLRILMAWLVDPAKCAFVIVTRPSALPRLETERLARELDRLQVPVAGIVANAVTKPSCARCKLASEHERSELDVLERLALRAVRPSARSPSLVLASTVYPAPRGVRGLQVWHGGWSAP